MLYKDMTADERFAKFQDFQEAVIISQDGFCIRPYNDSFTDRKAWRYMEFCASRAKLIRNVAKKAGDAWAQ